MTGKKSQQVSLLNLIFCSRIIFCCFVSPLYHSLLSLLLAFGRGFATNKKVWKQMFKRQQQVYINKTFAYILTTSAITTKSIEHIDTDSRQVKIAWNAPISFVFLLNIRFCLVEDGFCEKNLYSNEYIQMSFTMTWRY